MIEIEKLRQGRKVSINEYNQAKLDFDDLYANASDDDKAKIDGLMRSSLNYSSANPMNNRSTREYQTQVYKNAAAILRGENIPSMAPTASTPNWFNGYSSQENQNNANYVTSRYLSHAGKSAAKAATSTQPTGSYHRYNWANGLSSGWTLDSDTLEDRMNSFASTLYNNLNLALSAKNSGKKLVGVDENNVELALGMLQNKTWTKDNFKDLMKAAQLAGVDPSAFRDYFGDLFPGMSAEEKAKKALTDNGYELVDNFNFGDYANDFANYKVAKKGDRYYLINSDYSGPATNAAKVFMNTDWRDPNKEGHGYIIGNDGSFIIGDLNSYRNDERYKNLIESYLKNLDNENRWMGNKYKFNKFTSLSDSDLLNTFAEDLHGQNIADLSRYFDGNDVIATVKGNNFDGLRSQYGHLRIDDPNLTFYYRSKDGLKKGTYQDIVKDLGDITLLSTKAGKGLQNFESIDYNLEGLDWSDERGRGDLDINRRSEWANWWTPNRELKNEWNGEISASDTSMRGKNSGIQNDPGKFARLMLYAYANSDKLNNSSDKNERELSLTLNAWLDNNQTKADLIHIIYELMSMHPDLFKDKRYLEAFKQLLMSTKGAYMDRSKSTEVTQMQKEGGILKAAMGAGLDANRNPIPDDPKESIAASMRDKANKLTDQRNKLVEQAAENGRTTKQQLEVNRNAWTSSDTLRATALATDIVGLIGAITGAATGGVGSAVAVGSGFASMAQDAIADFTDEKVSKGQAWKNVAINSGLAVGAMFGAKAPKMVKSAMKIVPKAMMALGAAGVVMDPEVQKTVDKITSGKGLNVNDWKNISIILRTATGIATVGTMEHGANKWAKKTLARREELLKKVPSTTNENVVYVADKNGKAVAIDKTISGKVNKLLKEGKKEKALKLLTETRENNGAGLSQEVADSIIQTDKNSRGLNPFKKGFWKPGENEQLQIAENKQHYSEGDLAAVENQLLNEGLKNIAVQANKNWHTKFMNLLDNKVPFIQQQDYITNSLLGSKYKNTSELRKAITDAHNPLQERKMNSELSRSDINSEVKGIDNPRNLRNVSAKVLKQAEKDVESTGVKVVNLTNFKLFISELRLKYPNEYQARLKNKRFVQLSKEQYNFKDGGKVNYQKLRK